MLKKKAYAEAALKAAVRIAKEIEATHSESNCKCRLCAETEFRAADITPPQKWSDYEMPNAEELEREFGLPKGSLTKVDS